MMVSNRKRCETMKFISRFLFIIIMYEVVTKVKGLRKVEELKMRGYAYYVILQGTEEDLEGELVKRDTHGLNINLYRIIESGQKQRTKQERDVGRKEPRKSRCDLHQEFRYVPLKRYKRRQDEEYGIMEGLTIGVRNYSGYGTQGEEPIQ